MQPSNGCLTVRQIQEYVEDPHQLPHVVWRWIRRHIGQCGEFRECWEMAMQEGLLISSTPERSTFMQTALFLLGVVAVFTVFVSFVDFRRFRRQNARQDLLACLYCVHIAILSYRLKNGTWPQYAEDIDAEHSFSNLRCPLTGRRLFIADAAKVTWVPKRPYQVMFMRVFLLDKPGHSTIRLSGNDALGHPVLGWAFDAWATEKPASISVSS